MQKVIKMLYKTCPGCNKPISYEKKYCDECQIKHDEKVKLYRSKSNKIYNSEKRNKDNNDFYHSLSWIRLSDTCRKKFYYLDIWSYYYENKIEYGDICHHIEELNKNKSRALDITNLIYLTQAHHNMIHDMYKINYGGMKSKLFELIDKWNKEIKG